MASTSRSRPSRRAASRKSYVIDETTSEEEQQQQPGGATPSVSQDEDDEAEDEEDEEEFDPTPKPKRAAPRRASRRQTGTSVTEETPEPAAKPSRRSRQSRQSKVVDEMPETSGAGGASDVTPMKRSRRGRPRPSRAQDEVSETSTISSTAEDSTAKTPRHSSPQRNQDEEEDSDAPMLSAPEEEEDDEGDVTVMAKDPDSPSKEPAAPPAKRRPDGKPAAGGGGTPSGTPAPEVSSLPTPAPSQSPEPGQERAQRNSVTPLADITKSANNQTPSRPSSSAQEQSQSGIEMVNSNSTVLEKPMDIVLKSRTGAQPSIPEEPAEPKPRMVITHLVLTNFKSYSGRQVVGPFHASFSSVVGPNGSGKSNVIDSLLFVFGFRASKMRQGKISALIHNSAQFPDLPYCEVEVHFHEVMDREDGGHDDVPDSQLIIARRAFKNNSSKYYMNGKEATFTTVTDLLRKRGIDLDHKRFLILQGEVESIAQMKSKAANEHDDGLLEYLEDIIGTSKYKTPIEEAAAEVENLNEVCTEKNNRVQHVEKEKSSLEDKKNKALAYIKDENDLAEKLSMLYQIYIESCSDNTRVTEEAILQMQESLNLELEKHQGNEDNIKQLRATYKKTNKEYETMEKQTQAIVKEMAKYDKESVKLEEKRKFLAGKQKKLEKAIQTSKLSASECASSVEKHVYDIEQKTSEITSLEKEMQREEKELASIRDSLKGKTQGLSDQISAKQKSLEPWNEKINEKQSAVAVAQSELDILREKGNAGAVALEEANSKVESIKETASAKSQELEQCRAEKGEVEKEVSNLSHELQKFTQKEPEYRQRLSTYRQKADEGRASLASTQNQGNVLSGLMRLKESGRISGFHGRLGNLGTIDEKYDVAISTACPQLDNLVVDSVEVGQQCIDYLRKNNLGRANFILLDRLPRKDLSSIFTPDSVPRLFDLVKPVDDKFAPAFYSVLQNTLVAKDLSQANRIAYGARRWRVVTLDGQLIDVSGTMSGGGTRVARGGMSSKQVADVTQEQVAKLDQERDEFEKRFQSFQEKQRQVESSLKSKKDEIPKLETRMRELQLEVESEGRNLTDAQRRVKELAAEHKPSQKDDQESASLEQRIASLNEEIEQLRAEMTGVEEEIQGLQDKIMEVGGVRLRSQKARVDGLKEQISLLAEEISNAEVSKSKNEKLSVKHEKTQVDSDKELQNVMQDLEKLDEDKKNQSNAVQGTKEKTEEAQEALQTKKEELTALKAELDEKTKELNETRAVEIEMRNKLEENQKVRAENEKQTQYWEQKLSKLVIQNVSDLGEEQESESLQRYTKDELEDMNKQALKAAIADLEERTQNASVDVSVLAEYRRRVAEHESRSADLASALENRDSAKSRLDNLRSLRLTGFMEGFSTISLRLKEMYQMITMGGNAELELVDSLDPFSEGILFSVMPPKKSWKNIGNLSGGEKTLSSLALVFALHHYRPTPLYVMDEIDAALDFRNVSIVASYIKERTKNAQFIVISLRNNMFELASRLVGVYKVNHMTKSVTVENKDYITGRT